MLKEIKWTYLDSNEEQSALTDDTDYLRKKEFGWNMIGFNNLDTKGKTWLPLGANIRRIAVYHAETGRLMTVLYENLIED